MRILHMLNWNLNDVVSRLPLVKKQGFDAIQINPMQPSKEDVHKQWWLSYQPIGFRIGNEFGSKEDLIKLCQTAKVFGIDIIVDVVCDHTANTNYYNSLVPHDKVDQELLPYYKHPQYQITNWNNRRDVINGCIGLPKLDLSNDNMQKIVFRYLLDLKKCGVSGFRFDAAKHIALPSEGNTFWSNTKKFLDDNNLYGYGQVLCPDICLSDEYSLYVDVLTESCSPVRKQEKKVTWVECHDEYLNKLKTRLSDEELASLYNELTSKYVNTLYYMRPWDNFALEDDKIREANFNTVDMGFTKTYRR